jgi:hypothetical protein
MESKEQEQEEEEEDHDKKWIEEQTKILNIKSNHQREPLPYIHLHLCYVDCNNSIVDLKTIKHLFVDEETPVLSEAEIIKIIESHKRVSNMSFMFSELAVFHVDLEPEHINSFDPENTTFLKTFPVISDVHLSESIFIFHPLNCLFFLFKQKSSLRQQTNGAGKSMKRVAFSSKKQTRRIT